MCSSRQSIPEWINKDFLKIVLNRGLKEDNIEIITSKISSATDGGDHFASRMLCATINYSIDKKEYVISLIIKIMPEDENKKELITEESDIFEVESRVYDKILPICNKMLQSIDISSPIAPRMLYYSLKPNKVIILDDLKKQGYSMMPITNKTDNAYDLIVTRLAQWHAVTFKMAADGNQDVKKFKGGSCNIPGLKDLDIYKNGFEQFKNLVSSMDGCEIYAKKLKNITSSILIDKWTEACNTPGKFDVLNHGDFHPNNMMFKHNSDNEPYDVIFIDFQLCHWGTPALDLLYIVGFDLEKREKFTEDYYNKFKNILKMLNYSGPVITLKELQSEILRLRYMELLLFAVFFPLSCLDTIESGVANFLTSQDKRSVFYTNKKFQNITKQMLPIFLEKGYLDL